MTDKPFYVDVGTSIVAIRCASNRDVIVEYDHARMPYAIELAERACDRMNKEAEIGRPLRNCDVGTAEEQYDRHDKYCSSQPTCKKCLREDAASACIFCYARWSQRPYEESEATDGGK